MNPRTVKTARTTQVKMWRDSLREPPSRPLLVPTCREQHRAARLFSILYKWGNTERILVERALRLSIMLVRIVHAGAAAMAHSLSGSALFLQFICFQFGTIYE